MCLRIAKFLASVRGLGPLKGANDQAKPTLMRQALKLAMGAGKTTAMAMLIALQTINAIRLLGQQAVFQPLLIVRDQSKRSPACQIAPSRQSVSR